MKALKAIGLLLAFVCIGVAGWRLSKIYGNDDKRPGPGGNRPVAGPTQTPTPRPVPPPLVKPARLVIQDVPGIPVPQMSDDDWKAAYPTIVSQVASSTEVVPISVPWRFGAIESQYESDEPMAQTMAQLVSTDLTWAHATYEPPPAFAVFRISGDKSEDVAAAYDAKSIAERVKQWKGTHAIGGILVRSKEGFVATLQIFDSSGNSVHEAVFDKPKPFFELAGDLSVAAIEYFGTTPNEVLKKHLHRDRCKNDKSLVDFGKTAFMAPDNTGDFGIYASILRDDPGFADARRWRAAWQRHISANSGDYVVELQRSLSDATDLATLTELSRLLSPMEFTGRDPTAWLEAVQTLAGSDHPDVLAMQLIRAEGERARPGFIPPITWNRMQVFVRGARKYPHHVRLIEALARGIEAGSCAKDPELTISLALTRLADQRRPAGEPSDQWRRIAESAEKLGRFGQTLAACERMKQQPDAPLRESSYELLAAGAKLQAGEFDEALKRYVKMSRRPLSNYWHNIAAVNSAFCATVTGRQDLIDRMLLDPTLTEGSSARLVAVCGKFIAGTPLDVRADAVRSGTPVDLLIAEADLAQGGDFTIPGRTNIWQDFMGHSQPGMEDRLQWVLLERYIRLRPELPQAAGFHEAAERERGDDPAVRDAVAAWRAAGGDRTLPSVDELIKRFNNRMPPQLQGNHPTSWTVVARVCRDIDEGRHDDARKLLDAYTASSWCDEVRVAWMWRRLEEAAKVN